MANLEDIYNTFKGGLNGVNGQLKYPLENQGDYLGKITFTPIEEKPVDMLNLLPNLSEVWDEIKEYGKLGAEAVGDFLTGSDQAADKEELLKKATGVEKSGLSDALINAGKGGKEGFYGSVTSAPAFNESEITEQLKTGRRISLYLPRAIQIQDAVSYDNQFQLGLIGGAVEAGLAGGSNVVGSILGAAAGEAAGLGNTLIGNPGGMGTDAAGILSGKIAAKIPFGVGDGVAGAVRSASKLTTNPNTRAIFKDVPIRNFSFSFQLIPTSQNEAIAVEKIIKTFREELYPEALQTQGVNVGYRFPSRFLIKVKYNNRDIQGIRFLPVYMQSFNATYNSATGGMHSDGRFSAVDITLAFTETRAISKKDVEAGY